jgi:hypothetical protein
MPISQPGASHSVCDTTQQITEGDFMDMVKDLPKSKMHTFL